MIDDPDPESVFDPEFDPRDKPRPRPFPIDPDPEPRFPPRDDLGLAPRG